MRGGVDMADASLPPSNDARSPSARSGSFSTRRRRSPPRASFIGAQDTGRLRLTTTTRTRPTGSRSASTRASPVLRIVDDDLVRMVSTHERGDALNLFIVRKTNAALRQIERVHEGAEPS